MDSDGSAAAGAVPGAGRVSCAARGDAGWEQVLSRSSTAVFVPLGAVRAAQRRSLALPLWNSLRASVSTCKMGIIIPTT